MKTVNLELSKQLKECGYPQEGQFWWKEHDDGVTLDYIKYKDSIASPTADEILERFSLFLETPDHGGRGRLVIDKAVSGWTVGYINDGGRCNHTDKILADAAARLYIYLKKENLI